MKLNPGDYKMDVEIDPKIPSKHGKSDQDFSQNLSDDLHGDQGFSVGSGPDSESNAQISGVFDANSAGISMDRGQADSRTKSSLRIRYEAEVKIIRRKLGDLEQIRGTLGLSQRKISQLLFVDPSAWTRWTRAGEQAPPHIYRMLQWYLALEEKYPALDTTFWLSAVAKVRAPVEDQRELEILRESHNQLRAEVAMLRESHKAETSIKSVELPAPENRKFSALMVLGFLLSFLFGIGLTLMLRR